VQDREGRGEGRGKVEGMGGEGVTGEGGKAVSAERKKWQAKGKALPVKKVTSTTQTDYIQEPTVIQVDNGIQMEVVLEELEKAMERKRERKGKGRAKDSEDTGMKDGSNNSDSF